MPREFRVLEENLEYSKLIEASAGTGKTYSVAILVLRMILEKKIPIEKILIVTFTKAAVAELETRIRKFIRQGYKHISDKIALEANDKIRIVIENAPGSINDKIDLLNKAVQSLDNLSVMTIHSFCQKTIGEFTFETNQSFDYEIITDDSKLLTNESDKFLREVLNVLNFETFSELWDEFKYKKLKDLLKKHLLGMKFIDSTLSVGSTIESLKQEIVGKKKALDSFIQIKFAEIRQLQMGKNALKDEVIAGNTDEFKRRFRDQLKKPGQYFVSFDFMKDDFIKCEQEIKKAEDEFINYFYLDFFNRSEQSIKRLKHLKGYLSYDDQIKTIHKALGNESFKEKLGQKYEAVFIDEFQDTDSYQYEIFSKLFSENSIVFYIGDPKQSIYGWRGADLDTYKAAKSAVGDTGVLTMNTNFRSTQRMIDALNRLLNPNDEFNMFNDNQIRYINVEQGASDLGEMVDSGTIVSPVTIWNFDADDFETNYTAVAQEIYRLLTDEVLIGGRRIMPRDIGVLVRENKEGDKIKKYLANLNIPSIKIDDAKILKSDEAQMIRYLIMAVVSPNRGAINRALNLSYFGFNTETLKTIDEEKHIEIFTKLRNSLREMGIYNMISAFLTTYGIRIKCTEDVLGQRVLTNINQVAEILHKIEKQFKYTPDELIVWMERNSDEGEEYEQRMESDEDAVQISTIHKAKGLEYKIVFAPCLSMIPKKKLLEKGNVNDFKKDLEYFFTLNYPDLSPDDQNNFNKQKEQENRRLIYVSLTRAVYKCYISLVPRLYYKKLVSSSLSQILNQYQYNFELIEVLQLPKKEFEIIDEHYHPQVDNPVFAPREKPEFDIKNTFAIHSFSALSKSHHAAPFEKAELGGPEEYDQFIFQNLGRGANIGTALHSIFERLNFADASTWEQTLLDASKYYTKIINVERLGLFTQLLNHIMSAPLNCNGERFTLSAISNKQKLPELEFCFSLSKVNRAKLNEILGEEADLGGETDIEGLMTGFIDLFFEHNGKYYVLDWKSNHLGNSVTDYGEAGLQEGMKGSNYHLQYYIYTIAMKRYLTSKLPDFNYEKHFGGVIYIFLRGVRENNGHNGIFISKPAAGILQGLDELFNSQSND